MSTYEDIIHGTESIVGVLIDIRNAMKELARPSVVYKPRVFMDGDTWVALYGENLQEGIAGFGMTPGHATRDFDKVWNLMSTNQGADDETNEQPR